jgi:excisionase family DNA binding protein
MCKGNQGVVYDYHSEIRKSTTSSPQGGKMPVQVSSPNFTGLDHSGLRSVRTVAEFLAISRSKVYQLMESGQLPYVKLGKSRRVRWSDVLALVERHTVGGEAA